jgi:flagellar biogenesis protein FliO
VSIVNQPNAASSWIRARIPALVGVGTFVVLVGILAPKLLTPLSNTSTASTTAAAAPSSTADGPTEAAPQPSDATPADMLRPIEQVVIGISVVIAVGLAVVWFVGRQRAATTAPGLALLNVTAALPLRQNCWAYLVEVGGQQFLAGVDPTGIRSVLPLPAAAQEPLDEPRGVVPPVLMPTIFPPLVSGGKR